MIRPPLGPRRPTPTPAPITLNDDIKGLAQQIGALHASVKSHEFGSADALVVQIEMRFQRMAKSIAMTADPALRNQGLTSLQQMHKAISTLDYKGLNGRLGPIGAMLASADLEHTAALMHMYRGAPTHALRDVIRSQLLAMSRSSSLEARTSAQSFLAAETAPQPQLLAPEPTPRPAQQQGLAAPHGHGAFAPPQARVPAPAVAATRPEHPRRQERFVFDVRPPSEGEPAPPGHALPAGAGLRRSRHVSKGAQRAPSNSAAVNAAPANNALPPPGPPPPYAPPPAPPSAPVLLPRAQQGKAKLSGAEIQSMGMPTVMVKNYNGVLVPLRVSEMMSEQGKRYFVTNTMHKGGFGKVRYAIDEQGQVWAIKEFRPPEARKVDRYGRVIAKKTRETPREDIDKELAILRELGQVDVVNARDGKVYAIMPLMDGEVEAVVEKMPVTVKKQVGRSVLAQMADGLDGAHAKNIVHLDTKLANALVDAEGNITVSDYGLARRLDPRTGFAPAGRSGTPGSMAPEVINGQRISRRADTWSLAIAFADVHVDWRNNPFSWGDTAGATRQAYKEFQTWRAKLVVSTDRQGRDKIDINRIKRNGGTSWDAYFHRLRLADDKACEFVLARMLHPEAANRADMSEVRETAKSWLSPAGSLEAAQIKRAWAAQLARDDNKAVAFAGLNTYRNLVSASRA